MQQFGSLVGAFALGIFFNYVVPQQYNMRRKLFAKFGVFVSFIGVALLLAAIYAAALTFVPTVAHHSAFQLMMMLLIYMVPYQR